MSLFDSKENESPLSGLERYSNALRQEYKSDGDRSMSYELWLCDRLQRKQTLIEFGQRLIFDATESIERSNQGILNCEGENRNLIDQINTLEYEKVQHISTIMQLQQDVMDLEMKVGATDSDLRHVTFIKDKAFDLLQRIGNGQIPQAELWQKINDLVNLPF